MFVLVFTEAEEEEEGHPEETRGIDDRVPEGYGVYIHSEDSLFDMPVEPLLRVTSSRRIGPLRGSHTTPI